MDECKVDKSRLFGELMNHVYEIVKKATKVDYPLGRCDEKIVKENENGNFTSNT